MKKLKLKDMVNMLYPVNKVDIGYNYWFNKLLLRCMSIFKYTGLPDSLPAREIELNLLLTGHAVIFEKGGKLYTNPTSLYGTEDSPYYYPTKAIYANPKLLSSTLKIGSNAEVIYNNPLQDNIFYLPADGGMLTFIQRYARQLADIEATINIYVVNTRTTSYPTASNDNVKASIERFFQKLEMGERSVVTDNAIIEQFRNLDINRTNVKDGINDLLIARDKILEMFYRDIGVKFYNPKKAQVTEDEVESNDQLLLISTKSMLETRLEGIARVNEHWKLNINVEITEEFKPAEGVQDNVKSKE